MRALEWDLETAMAVRGRQMTTFQAVQGGNAIFQNLIADTDLASRLESTRDEAWVRNGARIANGGHQIR